MAAYFLGPGGSEDRLYSAAVDPNRQLHETLGISVLVIVLLRIVWHWIDRGLEDPPMAAWMLYAAKIVHYLLYVLLIAAPLTAIVGAWLERHPGTLLGFGNIGPMLPLAHSIGQKVASLHPTLGDAILWVAGLHAAAALYHHFFLRDRVLVSMLPGPQ